MTKIPTAAGGIETSKLGRTIVHEPLFGRKDEYRLNYQQGWDEQAMVDKAVPDLTEPADLGIDTMLAPTVLGRGHIVISHDASCFTDFFDPQAKRAAFSNFNYRHISENVLPDLRLRGVTESPLHTNLVDNP